VRSHPARRFAGLLLAVSVAATVTLPLGCASSEPKPQWLEREVGAGSAQLLIDVTALSLQKCGFPVGAGIDPGHLVALSGWHISLMPFRGKGFREQCEVRYERVGPARYKASIRVRREKNDDILRPLDLTYAKWVPQPDDPVRAQVVMQYILSMLGTEIEIDQKQ
jgi:hypothetical protein